MEKINIRQKMASFDDYWQPHIAGELNGQYVKFGKFKGPFTWHHHENEDELFLVVKGRFRMEYREADVTQTASLRGSAAAPPVVEERSIWLEEGEMMIVPRGVEHRPVADEECHVLLFEPVSTLNTGNIEDEFTVKNLQKI
ncbi:MAG: cupin domain-containing protein [Pyrinomonadaceae bacterium]